MEIYFTREHEWARLKDDGTALVGISAHAAHELGDITFVELPQPGRHVKQFELLGSIESVKAASDIFAPVSGKVIEVNQSLETAPEVVNQSPEEGGWMALIRVSDPDELKKLMTREQYDAYLKELQE